MTEVFYTVNLFKAEEIEDDIKVFSYDYPSHNMAITMCNTLAEGITDKEHYFVELLRYSEDGKVQVLYRS